MVDFLYFTLLAWIGVEDVLEDVCSGIKYYFGQTLYEMLWVRNVVGNPLIVAHVS